MSPAFRDYVNTINPLSEHDWNLLGKYMQTKRVSKNCQVLRVGEVCHWVAFVQQGVFRRFGLIHDEEVINEFVVEYHFLSDYNSFLSGQPATSFIEALEPGELLVLSVTDLKKLYEQSAAIQTFARRALEESFMSCQLYIGMMANKSSLERYQLFIQHYPTIIQRVPLYMVASFLSMRPETLSRIRHHR
jgi:CRP-like cAMP-binding protein